MTEQQKRIINRQIGVLDGLAFWRDGEPRCKIKRSDFGLEWPVKEA